MKAKELISVLAPDGNKVIKKLIKRKCSNREFLLELLTMRNLSSKWRLTSHEKSSPVFEFKEESDSFKCIIDIEEETVRMIPIYLATYKEETEEFQRTSLFETIMDFFMEWFNLIGLLVFLMLLVLFCEQFITPIMSKG